MEFLNTTSAVAAFLAGIAALFAPCCITVLLPSYLASIFRQRATVFLMTFVFFLGILTIFLPIGLSFGWVGQIISRLHDPLFLTGGLFLLFLGLFILLGFHYSLPFSVSSNMNKVNPFSVYILGIFSGLATTCCAPVLAGVMALSVLPGSIFWAGMYTVSYVLGMTVPLFLIAIFLDNKNVNQKLLGLRKTTAYNLAGRKIELAFSELLSGGIFLLMGLTIIYLTLTHNLSTHASYQLTLNLYIAQATIFMNKYFGFLPQIFWAFLFLIILIFISIVAFKKLRRTDNHE